MLLTMSGPMTCPKTGVRPLGDVARRGMVWSAGAVNSLCNDSGDDADGDGFTETTGHNDEDLR